MKTKNNKATKSHKPAGSAKQVSKVDSQDSKLQKLIKDNPHFQFIESGKVKCILTKHQFAPTLENYQQYLKSKSYKKGLESQFNLSDYEEFLVPFKDSPHFLFCRLTGVKLPKKKTAIQRHINSRKFKTRMQQVLAENEQQQDSEELEDLEQEGEEEQEQELQEEEEEESEGEEEEVKVKNGKGKKK